jgi:hypothetical protein
MEGCGRKNRQFLKISGYCGDFNEVWRGFRDEPSDDGGKLLKRFS